MIYHCHRIVKLIRWCFDTLIRGKTPEKTAVLGLVSRTGLEPVTT